MGQPHQRANVHVHHHHLSVELALREYPHVAQPCVVDQELDLHPATLDLADDALDLLGQCQVRGDDVHADLCRPAQIRREGLEAIATTRHQDQVDSVLREEPGELLTQPRGGSGDQRSLSHGRRPNASGSWALAWNAEGRKPSPQRDPFSARGKENNLA